MNVAVIPARGGSKRIPKKNIKDFCGKPIIAWPIDIAKQSERQSVSNVISNVYVYYYLYLKIQFPLQYFHQAKLANQAKSLH